MLTATNPCTGQVIAEYTTLSSGELHEKIGDAFRAADQWQASSIEERGKVLRAVAAELRVQKTRSQI